MLQGSGLLCAAMTIKTKLQGDAMQQVVCQLEPGQQLYAEAGKFLWKTVNVGVETRLGKAGPGAEPDGQAGGGGPGGPLWKKALNTGLEMGKRRLAGESLAFQHYSATGGTGLVSFAGVLPGQMEVLELDGSRGWYAEKDAFVLAESTVGFDIEVSGFKAGRKGGEGFILEKFSGAGTLVISGAGNFIRLDLAKYGGKVQVDTGCVVAFQEDIRYGVERIGALNAQTMVSAAMGGEGLNLATLEGEGEVILQSMTYEGMGKALRSHVLHGNEQQQTGGGALSSLLGGGND